MQYQYFSRCLEVPYLDVGNYCNDEVTKDSSDSINIYHWFIDINLACLENFKY